MQIFKSFDFRTMGLWIWITFILIRTVYPTGYKTQKLVLGTTNGGQVQVSIAFSFKLFINLLMPMYSFGK